MRNLHLLNRGGYYLADYRYDEGLRVRDEPIVLCLQAQGCRNSDASLSGTIYLMEVIEYEDKKCDQTRVHRSAYGGCSAPHTQRAS